MRFHGRYPLLQLWQGDVRSIICARTLSVARFEPTVEDGVNGGALLDLVFVKGESVAVVPFIRVQPSFLLQRERTPLIWPSAARDLGIDTLLEIENEVLPWLQSLSLARQQNAEAVRSFGNMHAAPLFEYAREAGFLGAVRYGDLMPAFAPYVYAARFGDGCSVGIEDDAGATGAVMLARRGNVVRADLGSGARNALATSWFGSPLFGSAAGVHDVVIMRPRSKLQAHRVQIILDATREEEGRSVSVASAVPADIFVSFDPDDASVARTFCVQVMDDITLRAARPAEPPEPQGGSSGTVLMIMRDGFERSSDADVDEAHGLAARLRAEGFTVDMRSASAIRSDDRPDLVHAFSVADPAIDAALKHFHRRGLPVVANTNLPANPAEAAWGPGIVAAMHSRASDEALAAEYFELIALRKLRTEDATPDGAFSALAHVDVAIVAAPGEEAQLRSQLPFHGEIVRYSPMPGPQPDAASDIAALVGTAPFVLVHAPVEWRTNLPLLARAAAARGMALVAAGPVVDFPSLRHAAQQAPESVIHIPNPAPDEVEALYRAARVYADVSWAPRGIGRIARAAASGCRLLLASFSFAHEVWPNAVTADPGSLESISAALDEAWNAAVPAQSLSGNDLFSAAIFAYSRALQARQLA
jgi:hypothetical protein